MIILPKKDVCQMKRHEQFYVCFSCDKPVHKSAIYGKFPPLIFCGKECRKRWNKIEAEKYGTSSFYYSFNNYSE